MEGTDTEHAVKNAEVRNLSVQALAFVGDAVYGLMVRRQLIREGDLPVGVLHSRSVEMVNAQAQADAFDRIAPFLSEEEFAVMKRGRNSNAASAPKNADVIAYRKATGLETLFGFLEIDGRSARVRELFALIWAGAEVKR